MVFSSDVAMCYTPAHAHIGPFTLFSVGSTRVTAQRCRRSPQVYRHGGAEDADGGGVCGYRCRGRAVLAPYAAQHDGASITIREIDWFQLDASGMEASARTAVLTGDRLTVHSAIALRPAPPPLIIQRAANSPLSDAPVDLSALASKSKSKDDPSPQLASVTVQSTDDPVYICGARTKKGTPCHRRVHAAGERCFQHKGMPAILPLEKLKINS